MIPPLVSLVFALVFASIATVNTSTAAIVLNSITAGVWVVNAIMQWRHDRYMQRLQDAKDDLQRWWP